MALQVSQLPLFKYFNRKFVHDEDLSIIRNFCRFRNASEIFVNGGSKPQLISQIIYEHILKVFKNLWKF